MKEFQSMIVGMSLCEGGRHLLQYVAMLCRLGIADRIRFVHVVVPRDDGEAVDKAAVLRQMELEVAQAFGDAGSRCEKLFDVRIGVRVDELLAYVEAHPADVVLLGHRKNRSAKRTLARRMAMISPTSVWLVPEDVPCRMEQVLAPIDFSRHSADSLETAAALAAQAGQEECSALHVYFDESTIRYDERDDEIRGREQAAFDEFVKPLNLHGVKVTPLFEEDANVTLAILRVSEDKKSDLIVMSTRGRSPAASILLGSETGQTLMESPVPVLAVKHEGARLNLFQALMNPEIWKRSGQKTN